MMDNESKQKKAQNRALKRAQRKQKVCEGRMHKLNLWNQTLFREDRVLNQLLSRSSTRALKVAFGSSC